MSLKTHPFAIGIDLGTGSCKSALLDRQGNIIAQVSAQYPAAAQTDRWQEQHPWSLLAGVIECVAKAVHVSGCRPEDCTGLSIGGALHSLTALDRRDRALIGVLTWADGRAKAAAARMKAGGQGHAIYLQTGCPVHPLYPFEKICWLREEEPELFSQSAWFVSGKEYVLLHLTGKRVVDYSIAGASGLLNTHSLDWDKEVLALAGISPAQLFTLTDPSGLVGGLQAEFARQMGLLAGTPVYMGSSDAVNSSLGAGSVSAGQMTCMIGTSAAIRTISPKPVLDQRERTWCYALDSKHWLVGGAINNGGMAVQWFRDALCAGLPSAAAQVEISDMMGWAEQIPAGSDGVMFLPLISPERSPDWNANVRGTIYGLQLKHDQRHLSRALLEGMAYRLRSVFNALDDTIPGLVEIRASGGFSQSPVWQQICADVFNRSLHFPTSQETSAIGAAFWVMLGSGQVSSLEELGQMVPVVHSVVPQACNRLVYDQQYSLYIELYAALQPIFEKTAQF